jgi:hypothetical protein
MNAALGSEANMIQDAGWIGGQHPMVRPLSNDLRLAPAEYEALTARFCFRVIERAINDTRADGRTVWLCQRNGSG